MHIIIHPKKLAEVLAEKPHLLLALAGLLEEAAHTLPEHRPLIDDLLNEGAALKVQSDRP